MENTKCSLIENFQQFFLFDLAQTPQQQMMGDYLPRLLRRSGTDVEQVA
jgi:hypothetical protein